MDTERFFCYLDLDNPMVTWETYIGRLASADTTVGGFRPLSLRSVGFLQALAAGAEDLRRSYLDMEAVVEAARRTRFPRAVSRMQGFYVFTSETDARRAAAEWRLPHFRAEWLTEIEFNSVRSITRADSDWITYRAHDPDRSWVDLYWEGRPFSDHPLWECICSGEAVILNTPLRVSAGQLIEARDRNSLFLADLGRISHELGFSLGRTVPFLYLRTEGILGLRQIMDFRQAEDPEFLAALAGYQGPRNVGLPDPDHFYMPDFRSYFFDIPASEDFVNQWETTVVPPHGDLSDLEGLTH